ncbi:MAG: ChaN family lipoprotein [Burkholderiaceae bacterium]|nr:ChaN family lipoprotein [Burkholderiaceae bacterium]
MTRFDLPRRRLLAAFAAMPLAACATRGTASPETAFTAENLAQAIARRPVMLLGEVHDNPVQHRVRAEALALLLNGGARPALAFEQFDREQQPAIDAARRTAGGDPIARADRLIETAGRGGWNWVLYRPFIELALRFDLPVVAANLSRSDAMKVGRADSFDAVFDRDTQRRFGLDRLPQDFLQRHERVVDDGHCNTMPPHVLPALARAQIARDATLLVSIRPHAERGVVLLTGNGHARNDLGIPYLMGADERARTVAVGLLETPPPDADDEPVERLRRLFDVAFVTPRHERPDPCEPLRQRSAK